MNISKLAFRYQPVVWMLVVGAMFFGLASYFTLPAQEDPKIIQRVAVVTTRLPGLSSQKVELLITKPLEAAIREIAEVKEIRSTSQLGLSVIHVEVNERYSVLEPIWTDLRNKINQSQIQLPENTQPSQVNDDFGDVAVVTAALYGEDIPTDELYDYAQHIRDQIAGVEGTKRVEILGAQEERIFVETTNAQLTDLGITPATLTGVLRAQNTIKSGGSVQAGARQFVIHPTGNFDSVQDIGETLIPLPNSKRFIRLNEFATITRGTLDPPRQLAYYQGKPAIILSINMLDGNSVLDYGEAVKNKIDEIKSVLPLGVELDIATFQADQVANAVYGVTTNVVQTLAIVLAVVILFLGLRTGLIVGAIVPAVMLVTLAIMGFFDIALQRMSLATLVIALGLLVDNGIVIAEDFKRRLEDGATHDEALDQTGRELAFPLLSSTLTTILVFLPLMLAQHQAGEYTRSISQVVAISLLVSWLMALAITPLLCYHFIKVDKSDADASNVSGLNEISDLDNTNGINGINGINGDTKPKTSISDRLFNAIVKPYERILRAIMHFRWPFMGVMVLLLAGSIYGVIQSPKKFFPDSDRPQVLINVDLPAGSTIEATGDAVKAIMQTMSDTERFPHIKDFAGYVGFGGPRFVLSLTPVDPAANRGFLVANIDEFDNVDATILELRQAVAISAPEALVRVKGMFLGPSDSTILEIQAKGPDVDVVFATAEKLSSIMASAPGTLDLYNDWENKVTNVDIDINQAQARRAGVTSTDIADSIQRYFSGDIASFYREGDERIPIVLRAASGERSDLSRVKSLTIYSERATSNVILAQVADVQLVDEFGVIAREDMMRTVTVQARNTLMAAEDMLPLIQEQLDELAANLPAGHSLEIDGVVGDSTAASSALGANVPLCFALIVLLLVIQFNGYKRPVIILATIPLLLIGAAIGIYALNVQFGFMIILGLFALAGIIINNAIVLIDRIDIEREDDSTDAFESIISASSRRLRPILITTITTILGLLPLIILKDALFFGMATVIAFGLAIGTILTLGVVPVLYSLVFKIEPSKDNTPTESEGLELGDLNDLKLKSGF